MNLELAWRIGSFVMLGWLACFFGATLRPGRLALITRIACVSTPALPAALVRYTRWLTALWCAYFVCAAVLSVALKPLSPWFGALVWAGTVVLFVGEHRLRPCLFPGHVFPGLRQQLKDTVRIWRPLRHDAT
ncbi:MAG: hypothetical protein V4609_04155 [Pseudomonadota bacterium]